MYCYISARVVRRRYVADRWPAVIEGTEGASLKCVSAVSPIAVFPCRAASNREEPPAVGSLTPDHDLRIIAERASSSDRPSREMHRSCAYYSLIGVHPYKSHTNIPRSRNSLSCVCLRSPTSETLRPTWRPDDGGRRGQRQSSLQRRRVHVSSLFRRRSCGVSHVSTIAASSIYARHPLK